MMNMMNTTGGTGFGFSFLWAVHILSVIVFFSGLIFLIVWAIKTLPAAQLKSWALGLLFGGAVLCLLTIGARGAPWTLHDTFGGQANNFRMNRGSMMMGGMMDRDGGMGMMSTMGMMLQGLEGDEFDEAFIRLMIPHHEGAIDMAERALESSNREEMKKLARDIIEAQQREIDMMEGWLTTWGYEN